MKIFIIVLINIACCLIGFAIKYQYTYKIKLFKYLKDFVEYYNSNLLIFKNNLIEIIDNYIIMQKNKNAKYNNIFCKYDNIYQINYKILKQSFNNNDDIIENYLNNLGKSECDNESTKNLNIISYLNSCISENQKLFESSGSLYFKLMLAVGAVLSILIW